MATRTMEARTGRTNQRKKLPARGSRTCFPFPLSSPTTKPFLFLPHKDSRHRQKERRNDKIQRQDANGDLGYSPTGERLVAGVVPLSPDKSKVLLIQSARPGAWVLPKGGWELDEPSAQVAAVREAWEEAGVVCTVTSDLGKIPDMRSAVQISAKAPRVLYQFFEVRVDREESQWPEMHKRKRQWVTYPQAAAALVARPELLDALNRSSIKR